MSKPRCKGLCCAAFYIQRQDLFEDPRRFLDGETVAAMVVPLKLEELPPATRRRLPTLERCDHANIHTCNRWDSKTLLCTRYEERPDMCRRFPYGQPCHVLGCKVGHPTRSLAFHRTRKERMAGK